MNRDVPNYAAACRQPVTLYNKAPGANLFTKTVFSASAFLESKKVSQEIRTGIAAVNPSLLVIPQGAGGYTYADPAAFDALADKTGFFTLRNGDKVIPGIGPDVVTPVEWAELSKISGAVTIAAVDVKRDLAGGIVHIEGGGS